MPEVFLSVARRIRASVGGASGDQQVRSCSYGPHRVAITMDITLYEIKMDNLEVRIKGTKPDEVAGCRYIVYIKKKLFDPDIMGNSRECVRGVWPGMVGWLDGRMTARCVPGMRQAFAAPYTHQLALCEVVCCVGTEPLVGFAAGRPLAAAMKNHIHSAGCGSHGTLSLM